MMNRGLQYLLVLAMATATGVSQAELFRMQGDVWGNTTAPNGWIDSNNSFGRLPGGSDDARVTALCDSPLTSPCASVYMRYLQSLGGGPVNASVSSFDGSGRRLHISEGASLSTVRESNAGGLTLQGGQLTSFSTFTLGPTTVNESSVRNPSLITGPGAVVLLGNTDVMGTLEFRGSGQVSSYGTLTQSGNGNLSLSFSYDFRNRPGGVVDIRNDNGIALVSPNYDQGPTPIQFHNEAGATLSKSNGSGTSVVEVPIVNTGRISAGSGQLTLAGGGTHASGARLETSGAGIIGLQGAHTITGAVTTSGTGSIFLGEWSKPGNLSIAGGGTLSNSSSFFQSGTFTVESGGRLDQGQSGGFYASSNLNVASGGKVETSGLIQLEGALVNNGDVTVKGSGVILGNFSGNSSYQQLAGTTVVESSGYFGLQDGKYQQDGGSTTIAAGGTMDLRACDASTGACTGGSYTQTGGAAMIGGNLLSGTYQQNGGSTAIAAGGSLDLRPCDAFVIECIGGTYSQTAGETKVNGSLFAETVRFTGGELSGSGTIFGNVAFEPPAVDTFSGTIMPANSPGRLAIDGGFSATNAIFNIEIGGPIAGVNYDQLFVTGDATIDGGLVNFMFIDGYLPNVGDIFNWLVAQSLTFMNPQTFAVSSSTGTVYGELIDGAFKVTEVSRPGSPGQVPEPGTLALLALALAGLRVARRRESVDTRG